MEGLVSIRQRRMEGLVSIRQRRMEGLVSIRQRRMEGLVSIRQRRMEGLVSIRQRRMEGLVSSLKEKRGLAKQDESSIFRRWARLFLIGFAESDGAGFAEAFGYHQR